jgi:hypothetical protein
LLTLCVTRLTQRLRNVRRPAPLFLVDGKLPGEALVPSSLPVVVKAAREAFPGLGWARGVDKRHNGRQGAPPRAWSLWQKFEGHRPLFMGLLALDCS